MGDNALVLTHHSFEGEFATYHVLIDEDIIDLSSITSYDISYLHIEVFYIYEHVIAHQITKPLWE